MGKWNEVKWGWVEKFGRGKKFEARSAEIVRLLREAYFSLLKKNTI